MQSYVNNSRKDFYPTFCLHVNRCTFLLSVRSPFESVYICVRVFITRKKESWKNPT